MKESKAYQEILQEGRDEGEYAGQIKDRRAAILEFVQARFGKRAAVSLSSLVNSIDDYKELQVLTKLAAQCSKVDDLIHAASR